MEVRGKFARSDVDTEQRVSEWRPRRVFEIFAASEAKRARDNGGMGGCCARLR